MPLPENPVIYLSFANNAQNNLPALTAERKTIKQNFIKQKFLEVQHEAETEKDDIFKIFSRYSGRVAVWHYGGHAGKMLLQLTDTNLKGQTLTTLITEEIRANPESLALVFLNGCNTYGLVNSLLEAGVKCVIATGIEINDDIAKTFAAEFYETWVGTGKGEISVQAAYQIAQACITNEPKNNHIRWTETIGSENNNDAEAWDAEAWGLYQREAGIANTITLKSIAENYHSAPLHYSYQNPDFQHVSTLKLEKKKSYKLDNIRKRTIEDIPETILETLKEIALQPNYLQIIVLAGKSQSKPCEWQPYQTEAKTILELMLEFNQESKLGLHLVFVNEWTIRKQTNINKITDAIRKKTILIVDYDALENEKNLAFLQHFNHADIGGLLIPKQDCESALYPALDASKTRWRETFDAPYMFIDLAVSDKQMLFRRLKDIEHYHISPQKNIQSKSNVYD